MDDVTERNGTSSRLLTLLSLLQVRRDWPGATLAERLDVTPRTVRRDVDRLRGLGYPVRALKGPGGGYRLEAGTALPPLLFDDEQAVALAIALQLAATSGAGIGEAAARALGTVRQVLPTRLRHRVDAVHLTPLPASAVPDVDPAVLTALAAAVRAREVLRFGYAGDDRRAEPHHLITRRGRWYLLGFDLDRGDWRAYRADRLTPRTPTGPRFAPREVPGGDPAAFVDRRFRGSTDPTGAWPCTGTVELAAPASRVTPFAHDGTVEALGPERCRLTLGAWSWVGLAAAVARHDADVLAVSPPALAEAFRSLSQRLAAAALAAPAAVR